MWDGHSFVRKCLPKFLQTFASFWSIYFTLFYFTCARGFRPQLFVIVFGACLSGVLLRHFLVLQIQLSQDSLETLEVLWAFAINNIRTSRPTFTNCVRWEGKAIGSVCPSVCLPVRYHCICWQTNLWCLNLSLCMDHGPSSSGVESQDHASRLRLSLGLVTVRVEYWLTATIVGFLSRY